MNVLLLDNRDSFVYNLVDAFEVAGHHCTVVRNTTPIEHIQQLSPDLICLSPGPGYPTDAGVMMELIGQELGKTPILGICLGFQALLEHFGGHVGQCGPVHGKSVDMTLTDDGLESPLFDGLTTDSLPGEPGRKVPVARYHSLGCTAVPEQFVSLATTPTDIGPVTMAAQTTDGMALGFQFHPESVLTMSGPVLLDRALEILRRAGKDSAVQ